MFLKDAGFDNIANLPGGNFGCKIVGFQVIKKPAEMSNGLFNCMLHSETLIKINFK